MRFFRRIRFILNIKKFIPFLFDFFKSPSVPPSRKVLSLALMFGYFLFPFDAVPDFLVLLGIVDDVAVIGFVLQLIVKMAPQELKAKYGLIALPERR